MTIADRRTVLAGMMGSAIGLALAGCSRPATRSYDAVVLGAGVSGLQAAHLLEEAGLNVAVLEARPRVGGRVLTLKQLPGYPEMGFNSMGAGYGRGLDLAKQLQLDMAEVGHRYSFGQPPVVFLGGEAISREAWASHPANPFPAQIKSAFPAEAAFMLLAAKAPIADWTRWMDPVNRAQDISFAEFLKQGGMNEDAIRLAYDHIPYHGRDASDVSSLMMAFNSGFVGSQMAAGGESFAVSGGNYQLTEAMAARLKGDVLTGMPVQSISSSDGRYEVVCRDGTRFLADKVVCALPLTALRKIELELPLQDDQAEAIKETPYQPISIVQLQPKTPFWEEDGLSPSMWHDGFASTVIAHRYGKTPEEVTGLMVQARGNLALEWDNLGKQDVYDRLISTIEKLRPAAKGALEPLHYHSWSQEEFSGGAWAYYRPGQATRFPQVVARAIGSVHFCGEHTEFAARGVEGALASAERVALEVMAG